MTRVGAAEKAAIERLWVRVIDASDVGRHHQRRSVLMDAEVSGSTPLDPDAA